MEKIKNNSPVAMKVVIIGNSEVGKSSLINRYVNNRFAYDTNSTIGVEFNSTIIKKEGVSLKLQLWDTAGQERFKSITRIYYRGSRVIILAFDMTNLESLKSLIGWANDINENANVDDIDFFLVGTKSDKLSERKTTKDDIEDVILQLNEINISIIDYAEVSAMTNVGVYEFFDKVCDTLLKVYHELPEEDKLLKEPLYTYNQGFCCN